MKEENIKMNRVWAMPSMHTFTIKPIAELVARYVDDPLMWVDPFAGENSPAEWTNDHNPEKPTKYHMEALDFVKSLSGILFLASLLKSHKTINTPPSSKTLCISSKSFLLSST